MPGEVSLRQINGDFQGTEPSPKGAVPSPDRPAVWRCGAASAWLRQTMCPGSN